MTHDRTAIWERIPEQPSKPAVWCKCPQCGDEHEQAQMSSGPKWTDEQIAEVLTGLVVSRQYREVEKLMRRMRDDMQADKDSVVHNYRTLLDDYEVLLAWAKRAYNMLYAVWEDGNVGPEILEDAPYDVMRDEPDEARDE